MPRHWLMKSEPEVYSFMDLARDGVTSWGGVRNYKARNLLRDEIKAGDGVIFYHSNASPSAAVGLAKVVRAGYPDPTQFDRRSDYHDAAATLEAPRWFAVDVAYERPFTRPLPLEELRQVPALKNMMLLQRGARLSVQPVSAAEWAAIVKLGGL